MVTLEADSASPQPLYPTMPLYSSRETYLHSSKLYFQVELPKIPKVGDVTSLGTKTPIEHSFGALMTMEISKMMASHDTTLPTTSTLPIVLVSTLQQHKNIKIANEMDRTDAIQQNNMHCSKHTHSTNQQQPTKPQHE